MFKTIVSLQCELDGHIGGLLYLIKEKSPTATRIAHKFSVIWLFLQIGHCTVSMKSLHISRAEKRITDIFNQLSWRSRGSSSGASWADSGLRALWYSFLWIYLLWLYIVHFHPRHPIWQRKSASSLGFEIRLWISCYRYRCTMMCAKSIWKRYEQLSLASSN